MNDKLKKYISVTMNLTFASVLISILLFHASMYNTINYYGNTLYFYKYMIDKKYMFNCSDYLGDEYFTDCAYAHSIDTIGGGCLDHAVTACYYAWERGYSCDIEFILDLNHSFSVISYNDTYCIYDYGSLSCRKVLI